MDLLLAMITDLMGSPQAAQTAFLLLSGGAVFAVALAALFLLGGAVDPIRARVRAYAAPGAPTEAGWERWARRIEPMARYATPSAGKDQSRVQNLLVHAGYRKPGARTRFYALKGLLTLALPVFAALVVGALPETTVSHATLAAAIGAGVGLIGPSMVLERLALRRTTAVRNALPDALDLLVVCTEAGLGLKAAIQRVAGELELSHPELAHDLGLVNLEVRAGIDRNEALVNLAERTGVEEIRSLVALLNQSMTLGTSVGETLRVFSEEFRDRRIQAAEEQAAKISTKMIFPMVLCQFPSFFLVAIGPAVLGAIRVLTQ